MCSYQKNLVPIPRPTCMGNSKWVSRKRRPKTEDRRLKTPQKQRPPRKQRPRKGRPRKQRPLENEDLENEDPLENVHLENEDH